MNLDNFKDEAGNWVPYIWTGSQQLRTKSGSVWYDMRTRCKPDGSVQTRLPRYVGCTMSDDFKDFNSFADWHMQQIGFSVEGYELDKDLLIAGNKLYAKDRCVLIPKALNMFLVAHNGGRGLYHQGVFLDKRRNKFQARFNNKGLGQYYTPEAAFEAFCIAKEAEARRWAKRLENKEFIVDERVIERLNLWTVPKD